MWCFSLHGNFGYMKFQPSNVDGGRIWRFLTTGIQFSNGLRKAEKMRTGSSRWKDWRDQGIYNPRHIYIYICMIYCEVTRGHLKITTLN